VYNRVLLKSAVCLNKQSQLLSAERNARHVT